MKVSENIVSPFKLSAFRLTVLTLLAHVVGLLNLVLGRGRKMALFCPPVPEGNRGDQALLRAVVDSLLKLNYSQIDLVQTSYHPIESIKPDQTLRIVAQHKSVFESPQCFREQIAFVLYLLGKRDAVLVGCDVLDEGYSPARSQGSLLAMVLAAKAVRSARIIGFSVNDTSSDDLFKRFTIASQAGVKLFARDAVTQARLQKKQVPNVNLVGDLAFLLQPVTVDELEDASLRDFIREHQGRLIGLNFTEGVMGKGQSKEHLFRNMVQVCGRLAQEMNLRFICIVHDDQGGVEYLRELHEMIEAAHPGISRITLPMPPASHLKCIAGQCLQVFTCRLHLGIATLGMGRAVTGFPYQGKFEGQFGHFGLSESGLVRRDTLPDDADALTELFRRRIQMSDELAAQVQAKLPHVLEMARSNFEGL